VPRAACCKAAGCREAALSGGAAGRCALPQVKTRLEYSSELSNTREVADAPEVALPSGVRYRDTQVGGAAAPVNGYLMLLDYVWVAAARSAGAAGACGCACGWRAGAAGCRLGWRGLQGWQRLGSYGCQEQGLGSALLRCCWG
jgi:hypothetical protein